MKTNLTTVILVSTLLLAKVPAIAVDGFDMDSIKTSNGDLEITLVGHGSLMFSFGGKVIHVDPWSGAADYSRMPKADIILITHEHPDHLDLGAIKSLQKKGTQVIVSRSCGKAVADGTVMINGETRIVNGLKIEAVPAYNVVHVRAPGQPFHPKGNGNGYVLNFADVRVYVAGDTEDTVDMKRLPDVYCAFLPMNLPYTMTPAMVAEAARSIRPKILYPYHMGNTDTSTIVELLKGSGIDVRLRKLQ